MNVSAEEKLDQIISSMQEMKNDFSSSLNKIESRIEEKYQNFGKNNQG